MKLEDLAGKNIAIPGYGTVQHFLLLLALEKANLSDRSVNVTRSFGPSNMELMLSSGQIDGFTAWEPFCADAVTKNIGVYLGELPLAFAGGSCFIHRHLPSLGA